VTGELKRISKEKRSDEASLDSSQSNASESPPVSDQGDVGHQPLKSPADSEPTVGQPRSDWIGRVIDERYQVIELIAEGGMGAVFKAKHLKLLKDVAIKVIRPEFAGDGDIAARFAREAMATARFEHPHVASAIDFGTLPEGGAYLVIQLVRGQSLTQLLEKEGRFPWIRTVQIGSQIADALSAAESQKIVHRDLKPDNVIIERRDDGSDLVKILDFGIARHVRDSIPAPAFTEAGGRRKLTRDGAIVGTPGYMAPEQAMGDRAEHAADLYALGVVLWECVAGKQLWNAEDLSDTVMRQLTEPIPSLRAIHPEDGIPEALDLLLAQLLHRTPRERPKNAAIVRDLLRQLALAATGLISLDAASSDGYPGLMAVSTAISDGTIHAALNTPRGVITPRLSPAGVPNQATPQIPGTPGNTLIRATKAAVASGTPQPNGTDQPSSDSATLTKLQTTPTQIDEGSAISTAVAGSGENASPAVARQTAEITSSIFAALKQLKNPRVFSLYFIATTALFLIFILSIMNVLVVRGEDPFELSKEFGRFVPEIPSVLWQLVQQAGSRLAEPIQYKSPEKAAATGQAQVAQPPKQARKTIAQKAISRSVVTREPVIKTRELRSTAAPTTVPLPPPLSDLEKIPRELQKSADVLINSKQPKPRLKAANKILSYQPSAQIPKFLIAAARLRKAQTCLAQEAIVLELARIADPRALPVLRQLADRQRLGCGPRKNRDCLACLRSELTLAIEKLEEK
jgi:hypothetical protein